MYHSLLFTLQPLITDTLLIRVLQAYPHLLLYHNALVGPTCYKQVLNCGHFPKKSDVLATTRRPSEISRFKIMSAGLMLNTLLKRKCMVAVLQVQQNALFKYEK